MANRPIDSGTIVSKSVARTSPRNGRGHRVGSLIESVLLRPLGWAALDGRPP